MKEYDKTTKSWKPTQTAAWNKGRLPNNQYTDWCDETSQYEYKVNLHSINNKKYLLRHGTATIRFIVVYKNSFTIAHLFRGKDKKYISTKRFSGKLKKKEVKDLIFKDAAHIADVRKKDDKPFRVAFSQVIVTLEEFKENFKPNEQMKKSYASTAKDTAMISLSDILKEKKKRKLRAGTHSASFNNAMRAIAIGKYTYRGKLPAVNIFAIWSNFDPESRLINTGKFDVGEPVIYEYEVLHSKTAEK
jgi:hypothetical protein